MDCEVKWRIPINKNESIPVGEYWYNKKEDSIAIDHPFPLPVQLKVTHSTKPELLNRHFFKVEVSKTFLQLPNLLRASIDFNVLCLLLQQLELLGENKVLVHGSCYEPNIKEPQGILNLGFQNTGKTYNTYKAVKNGAYLISEEYTVVDEDGQASSLYKFADSTLSWTTIKHCGIRLSPGDYLLLLFRTARAFVMPFMFEAAIKKRFKVAGFQSKIKEIRIQNQCVTDDLCRKLVYFTENEYNFMNSALLVAYAYVSGFNLLAMNEKRRFLLRMLSNRVDGKTEEEGS